MLIFYSLVILCCSIIQPWKINAQSDGLPSEGQTQLNNEAYHEHASKLSPNTVKVERIVKSSIYPYLRQDGTKASKTISKTINSGGVNTTIRLKFVKENPDNVSGDVVVDNVSEKSTDDNLNQNVMNLNKHATRSDIREIPSHKILLHRFTNKGTPEIFSKNWLQQLQNLKWPLHYENQNYLKDYKVQNRVQFDLEDEGITPVAAVVKFNEVNLNEEEVKPKHNANKEIKYLEERDFIVTTEKPIDKRFKISEPQKRLLVLLNGLVQNKEISYDFMKRLIHLFYKYGYQNQLLQVFFDFILKQIHLIQGNSDDPHQRNIVRNLMGIWNILYQQQSETQKIDVNANKKSKLAELSSEQLKVYKLLRILNALENLNANGQTVLRLKYLNELKALYDTYDNKDIFMNIMHNHWKKNRLNKNKMRPIKTQPKEFPNHSKEVDINGLLQHIFKQTPLINKNTVLVEHDAMKPTLHKIDLDKSDVLSRHVQQKVLFELLSKNKKLTTERPNDLVDVQSVYEEVEDDNLSITPVVEKLMKFTKKKNKPIPSMDGKDSIKKLYQMLIELLKRKNIRNKGQLLIKITEMINKIKSQNIDTINESKDNLEDNQDGIGGIWGILNKVKYKPEVYTQECVVGTSWMSNCESCICMLGGVPVCKRMPDCIAESVIENPMQCKPHSKFRLDKCNTCKCNALGIPVCTFMECKEPDALRSNKIPSKQESLKALLCRPEKTPTCAPYTNWRNGCHECVCDKERQRHCRIIRNCNLLPLVQEEMASNLHREMIQEE